VRLPKAARAKIHTVMRKAGAKARSLLYTVLLVSAPAVARLPAVRFALLLVAVGAAAAKFAV
jgi:hypothetical protein